MIECSRLIELLGGRVALPSFLLLLTLVCGSAALAEQSSSSINQTPAIDQQLNELVGRLEASRLESCSQKELLAKRQIEHGNTQLKIDIAAVPRYFYSSTGKRYANPDYESIVQSLKNAFEEKVANINEQLDKDRTQLNFYYAKRQADLRESGSNLKAQINSSEGSVQLAPRGTSMYVRNYINYGGVAAAPPSVYMAAPSQSVPELRAVAAKMKLPLSK